MLRAKISERLLALFTTRERATTVVGDLLELHCGLAAFWFAVLRTAWALSWRFGLAFLVAVSAEIYCPFAVNNWAARPPYGVDSTAVLSGWCFTLFTAAALFSAIRFGVRAAIGRLSFALAILTGLDLFFWWMPFVRATSATTGVLVLLLFALTREGRLALRRLLGAVVISAAPLFGMTYLVTRATAERCRQGCNLDLHNTPILVVIPIGFLLSGGLLAGVLGRQQERRALLS